MCYHYISNLSVVCVFSCLLLSEYPHSANHDLHFLQHSFVYIIRCVYSNFITLRFVYRYELHGK